MAVVDLRRYPVKGMGGEGLPSVRLDRRGLVGDRWYAVEDADGHFASVKDTRRFRRRDAIVDYAARTIGDRVVVAGDEGEWQVGDPRLDSLLSARMGTPVRVLAERDVPHQDMGAVSLVGTATLAWCAAEWGVHADPRRLRVNLVISTDVPFVEEAWVGGRITVGGAELDVVQRVPRCRMIDLDQDGAVAEGWWLRPLGRERDLQLGVYADVAVPGVISVGDRLVAERPSGPDLR
jgi:uncharacterized protein YcbX